MDVATLADQWEADASKLREYGQESAAKVADLHVAQLREALRCADAELLTPSEASSECGYSKRRLRELEAEAKLTNHGKKGAPRYRRGDLPTKARAVDGFDAATQVRALLA